MAAASIHRILDAMPTTPAITTIAQTIQLSLSPVFMLAGIGAILNVLAGRLARVIDRVRLLEQGSSADIALEPAAERARRVWELQLLDQRMRIINRALYLTVGGAIMTCLVVALMFVGVLARLHIGTVVALCFILAMLLLIAGLAAFMIEVHVSLRSNRVRRELFGDLPE